MSMEVQQSVMMDHSGQAVRKPFDQKDGNAIVMPTQMAVDANSMVARVPLGRLIDAAIQRTYHELTVLAELLPRKSDMERKIEIVQFASRTRQLFVRILALVKWAGSASKVDKCMSIISFLDKQSMLFTDSADSLATIARTTLVAARLPSFQLPCAIEVLTLGTYSKLPTCIRDRIVPPDPISGSEKKTTLLRLNHIIEQRLVFSNLPLQMRNLKIENGRVTFRVDHEFELCLTLLGDNPALPWRVLAVDILVEDKETGEGKELVHPLQVIYLQQLIQTRLTENVRPLVDAFNCLHSFCLSLQLEVLHVQAIHLCRHRLGDFIKIEEYIPGNRLVICYWRDRQFFGQHGMKLMIEVDQIHPENPLQVSHLPSMSSDEAERANLSIRCDHLSLEKLLIHTLQERSRRKLMSLPRDLIHGTIVAGSHESPPILELAFLDPCLPSERLLVSVDTLSGSFLAHLPQYDNCPPAEELEKALNEEEESPKILPLLNQLKIWMMKERCKKSVGTLQVHVTDRVPVVSLDHPSLKQDAAKLFFHFTKHMNYYLIAELKVSNPKLPSVNIDYFLCSIEPTPAPENEPQSMFENDVSKPTGKLKSIIHLDENVIAKGSRSSDASIEKGSKRLLPESLDPTPKKARLGGYFVSKLVHIICFCEEKLAYSSLSSELRRRNICHEVIDMRSNLVIDLIDFPTGIPSNPQLSCLKKDRLSSKIYLQAKGIKVWVAAFAFANPPLVSSSLKESGSQRMVYFHYDFNEKQQSHVVDELVQDYVSMAHLYYLVKQFALHLKTDSKILQHVEVKTFSYEKLVLGYGPGKNYSVTVFWKSNEKRYNLLFGVLGQTSCSSNPHSVVSTQLQHELNQHKSLVHLISTLNMTFAPLMTLNSLVSMPLLGVVVSRPAYPVQSFCILAQTSTHLRLIYRNTYCLDVTLLPDGLVAIRDGALSVFDKSKVLEDLNPIQGLKAFLSKFVDKSTQMRRLSQTEDDNPPSPVSHIESLEGYLASSTASPHPEMQRQSHGIGANPLTPSSPHGSMLGPGFNASPAPFPLASPPTHPGSGPMGVTASPSVPSSSVASPANVFGVNSPMYTASPSAPHTHSPAPGFPPSSGDPSMSMVSPMPGGWPQSPMSRPSPRPSVAPTSSHMMQGAPGGFGASRTLPSKAWAAAIPTLLNHQGFDLMCKPAAQIPLDGAPHPQQSANLTMYSQLERFLGCVFARRNLHKKIQPDENFEMLPTNEPGVIIFKNEHLQFRISLHPTTMQTLHLKVTPLPVAKLQYSTDDLHTLEQYFENRVVCAPYKPDAFLTFSRIINVPLRIQKDFIQLMRFELNPDRNLKWSIQWCLTVPPSAPQIGHIGMSAVLVHKTKILFFVQFTRNVPVPGMDLQTIIVPFVYDMQANQLHMAAGREQSQFHASNVLAMINSLLKRFSEFNSQSGECSIFPAIRDIMTNLAT